MINNELIDCMTLDLLAADTDAKLDAACRDLCDAIATIASIDIHTARAIMLAAHAHDPSESSHAAHLRDTIRDNTDFDL